MSQSDSQRHSSRKPRPVSTWLLALIVLALALAAGGVSAFLFRSTIKAKVWSWRSQDHLRKAEQLSQAGDWNGALQLALTAHKLDPASLQPLRMLFRAAGQTKSSQVLPAAVNLFEHPDCSFEEKITLLGYLDLSLNDRYFLGLFQRLAEPQRQHPDAQFLLIRFLLTRGGWKQAKTLLDDYFAKGGQEKRFQGLRARLLLAGNAEEQEQGQKLVASLMQDGGEIAQQAYGLLAHVPPALLRVEYLPPDLDTWVSQLPHPGAQERLIAAQVALAKAGEDPAKKEEIFRQAVALFGKSDPEPLCNWLLRFQRFDLILGVVDEEMGRKSLALFDHRLRALTSVQGADAAEAWLSVPLAEASPLQVWLSRAKLARLRRDRPLEQRCWKEALTVAAVEETGAPFLPIYRTALAMHETDIACRALLEATAHSGANLPASVELEPVIDYLYRKDRLADLELISQRLLTLEPGNPVLLNNVVYIALILGKPMSNAVERARDLVARFPKVLGLRTTLALALRKEKKSQEALSFLEGPEVDWSNASAADLTIRSLVLEDCGESARAEEVRKNLNSKELTASERRAFSAVFKDEPPAFDPDQLYSEVRSWMVQGGQKHARQLLEEYLTKEDRERRFLVLYAQILLELHYTENDPLRGQEIVAQLLNETDEHAQKALALLASLPANLVRPSLFPVNLQEWTRSLPRPGVPEQIAAAKVESLRASDTSGRERILESLISSVGKTEPEPVAALLTELERFDLILVLLDEKSASATPKLRDLRLQALLKTKGAAAAEQWLETSRHGEETPQAWLSTAKLRHGLGDASGTLNALREASSLAERDPSTNHFLAIYETATELGQIPVAIRALLSSSLHPQGKIPSLTELYPVLSGLYASDRLGDIHTLTRTLLNQDPKNDTLLNLHAYLSLVLKDPTQRALDVSADLVNRHPQLLGFLTTRALALTLNEKYEEALQALPQDRDAWLHASPVDLAILALAQENMGDWAAGAATRERFDPDELAPTERRAFAEAKRKVTAPPP